MSRRSRTFNHPAPGPSRQRRGNPNRSNCLFVSAKGSVAQPLPADLDALQLREVFHEFEEDVVKSVIVSSPTVGLQRVGKVTFKSVQAAASALRELNGVELYGLCKLYMRYWRDKDDHKLPVTTPGLSGKRPSTPGSSGRGLSTPGLSGPGRRPSRQIAAESENKVYEDWTSRTLYVKILNCRDVRITDDDLWSHFQHYVANVRDTKVKINPDTNLPLGYAFVTCNTVQDASRAIEHLQNSFLNGRHELVLSFKRRKESVAVPQPEPEPTTTLEVVDDVVGLMLTRPGAALTELKKIAAQECVELIPLPEPLYGFQVKGGAKGHSVVEEHFDQCRQAIEKNQVGYNQIVLSAPYKGICSSSEVLAYRESLKKDSGVVTACSFERNVVSSTCFRVGKGRVMQINIVVGNLHSVKTEAIVIPTDRCGYTELSSLQFLVADEKQLTEIGDVVIFYGNDFSCSYVIQALLPLSEHTSRDHLGCDVAVKNSLSAASEMHLGSIAFPGIRTELVRSVVEGLSCMKSTTLHSVCIVLDNRATSNEFVKALQDLTSVSSKNTGMESAASLATPNLPATPNPGLEWWWRDDDGCFKPYTPAATSTLNNSFKRDCTGISKLYINGTAYEVNFKLMKQYNLATCHQRDVVNSSSQSVVWKYQDDVGCFTSYLPTDSQEIESMFQAKDTSRRLVISTRTYSFDFTRMKQVNVRTHYERPIRRESALSETVKRKAVKAWKKLEFLCNDEVVVNLKGPSKSLSNVKSDLEKELKALLFSKEIPYPAKATPALISRLKETASKHSVPFTIENSSSSGASSVDKHVLKLEGLKSSVQEASDDIQQQIIMFHNTLDQLPVTAGAVPEFPQEWNHMSKEDQVKIVDLKANSPEFQRVSSRLKETLANQYVVRVQRVQNKWLWERYVGTKCRLHKKNAGQVNEKELFHGTRNKPAKTICESEEGFDMRFSREGMWGQANYFAVKASYSDTYSFHNNNSNEMILAKVLTGDSHYCPPDSTLRMPPEKHVSSGGDGQIRQVRYDSVNGETKGSQVFMTYANDQAYPAYIITYCTYSFSQAHTQLSQASPSSTQPSQRSNPSTQPPQRSNPSTQPPQRSFPTNQPIQRSYPSTQLSQASPSSTQPSQHSYPSTQPSPTQRSYPSTQPSPTQRSYPSNLSSQASPSSTQPPQRSFPSTPPPQHSHRRTQPPNGRELFMNLKDVMKENLSKKNNDNCVIS